MTWQWRSKRKLEGWMYGVMDPGPGGFSGQNVVFLYPDLATGIKGHFDKGDLVSGTAVEVVGERCRSGIKEVEVVAARHDPRITWSREQGTEEVWPVHRIGQHPTIMDPQERKSVYVDISNIPGGNEGLFAR